MELEEEYKSKFEQIESKLEKSESKLEQSEKRVDLLKLETLHKTWNSLGANGSKVGTYTSILEDSLFFVKDLQKLKDLKDFGDFMEGNFRTNAHNGFTSFSRQSEESGKIKLYKCTENYFDNFCETHNACVVSKFNTKPIDNEEIRPDGSILLKGDI